MLDIRESSCCGAISTCFAPELVIYRVLVMLQSSVPLDRFAMVLGRQGISRTERGYQTRHAHNVAQLSRQVHVNVCL